VASVAAAKLGVLAEGTTSRADTPLQRATRCATPVRFTRDLIQPDQVQVVTPLAGQTASGGVLAARRYVMPPASQYGKRLPLYAPTDLHLTSASYYKPMGAPADYQAEYSLFFDAGCCVEVQRYHVKGVSGAVARAVPRTPSSSSAGQQATRTHIRAGQQIGWFLGSAKVDEVTFRGTAFSDPSMGPAGQYQSHTLLTNDADGTVRIGGLNAAAPLQQMMIDRNHATWRAPESITVGQTHCWSDSR